MKREEQHCSSMLRPPLNSKTPLSGKNYNTIFDPLPALLPSEALVKESQNFWNVELNVFQIQIFLIIFLHFE